MGDSKDNVKVAIRIRPLNEKESQEGSKSCISVQDSQKTLIIDLKAEKKYFTFDYIASEDSSQQDLFDQIGKPISNSCLSGYNGTIFAYGQTGAGKTFTILGSSCELSSLDSSHGLLPRCFEYIFSSISEESLSTNTKFLIKCTYLEIYQEQIIDLLDPNPHNLQLREDIRHGVYVEGLIEETVNNLLDTYNILKIGTQNRHVGCTSMNKESSRSHSVFTLIVESKEYRDGISNFRTSRFSLIDLAGSERQKATDCAGERLKEAGMINKSLSALGNVINSLVDISEGKSRHVHYRDSKLTFLLKDSLGGNSKTFMVANVSPSLSVIGETLSTLKFAQRAKQIKNSAVVNEDTSGAVSMLRYEVKRLKEELLIVKDCSLCTKCQLQLSPVGNSEDLIEVLQKTMKSKQDDEELLTGQLKDKDSYIAGLKNVIAKLENKVNHDKMILKFRQATIGSLQGGSVDHGEEILALRKENEGLRDQVDNNPQSARLFVENEKLLNEVRELKNVQKIGSTKIQDLEEINQKLVESLASFKAENEKILEKMVNLKEKCKKMKKKNQNFLETSARLNEKISELELANLTMQTEYTVNEESNLRDFNYEESEKGEENGEKIDEILMTVGEQQVFLQSELLSKLRFESEIEGLLRENSKLKEQVLQNKEFKEQVWRMENDLEAIEKKQLEKDKEKDRLERAVEDLRVQLEVTKETLISKQETLNEFTEKNTVLNLQVAGCKEELSKTEENYKKLVITNKNYQESLQNFEDLQGRYDSLLESIKVSEETKEKLKRKQEKCKILKQTLQKLENEAENTSDSIKTLQIDIENLQSLNSTTVHQYNTLVQTHEKVVKKCNSLQEKYELFRDEATSTQESLKAAKSELADLKVSKVTSEETSTYYREEYLKQAQDLENSKATQEDLQIKLKLEKEKTQIMQEALENVKLDFAKTKLDLESRFNEASYEIHHLESELLSEQKKSSLKKDLESKTRQLEDEIKILKNSADSFQELNLVLTQKNAELTNSLSKIHSTHIPSYIADQLRTQVNEMQNEILQLKEENRSKIEGFNRKMESSWKKTLDEKNALISELKAEVLKMRERFMSEEKTEVKYLKAALANKEQELAELKEKGQEYYSQADEVLENMRKKCQYLQNEVNSLRDELRTNDPQRRNRSALRENVDPRSKYDGDIYAVKHMNSVLTDELSKNVEIIELLKRRNMEMCKKLNEINSANHQYEEEIEKLSEGLGKITDYVFSIPMIKFNPEENSIVDSTIKAISLLYEASCRRPPRHCN